jgi:hypothetical protein
MMSSRAHSPALQFWELYSVETLGYKEWMAYPCSDNWADESENSAFNLLLAFGWGEDKRSKAAPKIWHVYKTIINEGVTGGAKKACSHLRTPLHTSSFSARYGAISCRRRRYDSAGGVGGAASGVVISASTNQIERRPP